MHVSYGQIILCINHKNMNIDIGKMVIVGQMLNLGQFKVTVQGHLEVNLHQK